MTKDEMMNKYGKTGYEFAKEHIKEAMKNGERFIYMGDRDFGNHVDIWMMTQDDVEKLRDDGFKVERELFDEWKISW